MKQGLIIRLLGLAGVLLGLAACSTDVKINGDPKPILAVYGVLNPQQDTQYVRIAKAYLTEGDALDYAANTDLTLQNAIVLLKVAGQEPIRLQPLSFERAPGAFQRIGTLWFTTARILPDSTYTLEVSLPDDPTYFAIAQTTVPAQPGYRERDTIVDLAGGVQAYPVAELEKLYTHGFYLNNDIRNISRTSAVGFEARVLHWYGIRGAGGDTVWVSQAARVGPTAPFSRPNGNCNDFQGIGSCWRYQQGEVLGALRVQLPQSGQVIRGGALDRETRFEVTALDRNIFDYIQVNNPGFVDFTTARPEFSNIRGQDGVENVGCFGSINVNGRWVRLSECSKFRLGYSSTRPPNCPD
jgi:hypothetical protein